MLAREPCAGAGETGLHLVGDEQGAVVVAPVGEARKPPGCGHDEPALAGDRLDDDAGDVACAHGLVEVLQCRLQVTGAAVGIGVLGPVDLGREWAEPLLVGHHLAGERHAEQRAAVEPVVERDDRLAAGRGPRDLHRVLHGLGTGIDEQ